MSGWSEKELADARRLPLDEMKVLYEIGLGALLVFALFLVVVSVSWWHKCRADIRTSAALNESLPRIAAVLEKIAGDKAPKAEIETIGGEVVVGKHRWFHGSEDDFDAALKAAGEAAGRSACAKARADHEDQKIIKAFCQ